jgi:catalase
VAVLVADGFDATGVAALSKALVGEGAAAVLVGPHVGPVLGDDGKAYSPPFSILTTSSVLFDAVAVADGAHAADWTREGDAVEFVKDAYKHCKAVAASGDGIRLLEAAGISVRGPDGDHPADAATAVGDRLTRQVIGRFLTAMADHRLWSREPGLHLPM